MEKLTERFTAALEVLHKDRDPEEMVALFSDDATLSKLGHRHQTKGRDGARSFWTAYRDVFDDITVRYTLTVIGTETAALEWSAQVTVNGGRPFRYEGVSLLEGRDGSLDAFRTYYDSAALTSDGDR